MRKKKSTAARSIKNITMYIVPRSRPAAAAGAETIEILIYDMKIPLSPQSQRTHPAITKQECRNVKNLGGHNLPPASV